MFNFGLERVPPRARTAQKTIPSCRQWFACGSAYSPRVRAVGVPVVTLEPHHAGVHVQVGFLALRSHPDVAKPDTLAVHQQFPQLHVGHY